MKNIIRTTAIAVSFILTIALSFRANAQNTQVYDRAHNKTIGISSGNATGCNYEIRDRKGNIVMTGKIKSARTFYISTAKLGAGNFRFTINGSLLQEFAIK